MKMTTLNGRLRNIIVTIAAICFAWAALSEGDVSDARSASITGGQVGSNCGVENCDAGSDGCIMGQCVNRNRQGCGSNGNYTINANATCPECQSGNYSSASNCTLGGP
jgi:hypothetical protein